MILGGFVLTKTSLAALFCCPSLASRGENGCEDVWSHQGDQFLILFSLACVLGLSWFGRSGCLVGAACIFSSSDQEGGPGFNTYVGDC